MLHKLRFYTSFENEHTLDNEVEIDETFVGGNEQEPGIKIRKLRNVKVVLSRIKFRYSECLKETVI